MKAFKILSSLFLSAALSFGDDPNHESIYPFKERIHGMCAGHHHLSTSELKEICNQFPEYYDDILQLQATPPDARPERYLRSLTAFVILSDTLSEKQKHTFYRNSYNKAIEAGKEDGEWKWLLGLLVKKTNALSRAELETLMAETSYEPMKPLIRRAIGRLDAKEKLKSKSDQEVVLMI